ncbi:AAA family ATPase [Kitasatospora sp. NPDC004669]|uniref:AAA family ATPase n=1 Tax=Kitasatospora sp. NPDC004669 TaxID=3154555 RepID=UPI00339F2F41
MPSPLLRPNDASRVQRRRTPAGPRGPGPDATRPRLSPVVDLADTAPALLTAATTASRPATPRAAGLALCRPPLERRLARLLEHLEDDYDVCVVDCAPSIGVITDCALMAALHPPLLLSGDL